MKRSLQFLMVAAVVALSTALLAQATPELAYDANAEMLSLPSYGEVAVGQGTYAMSFAQQVRVDPQDNVWAVDAGSNMLMKFDPEGRLLLVLGRKPEAISVRPGPGVRARPIDAPAAPPAGAAPAGGAQPRQVPLAPAFRATGSIGRPMSRGTRPATPTSRTGSGSTIGLRSSTRTGTS